MTISEITRQGLHYARTCKSLWLFGFVVGMASGGSGGGSGRAGSGWSLGAGGVAVSSDGPLTLSVGQLSLIMLAMVVAIGVLLVVRFVSEGALIEGIARAHRGGTMTTREGFRSGLAHWVVLVQIALLYFAATLGSLLLLAAPCVVALRAFGPLAGVALGIPALAVGVPWLVTLYLVQAFASQIAVLENRHALDAIGKARLFLHGRLMHGLKLLVAMLLGTLLIAGICIAVVLPVTLLLVALIPVLRTFPLILLGGLLLLPVIYVSAAMTGTLRSSIWTIGYLTQVES
jgi:hypothetical protein